MAANPSDRRFFWFLEGAIDESGEVCRVPMTRLPFRVGRDVKFELCLPTQAVSWRHAEVFRRSDQLMVRDLESTNGTFLNELPVKGEQPLREGDLIHFATLAFKVGRTEAERTEGVAGSTAVVDTSLPRLMAEKAAKLQRLLDEEAVTQLLQPIVGLIDRSILGYEVLGRGCFAGLPSGVKELFELAKVAVEIHESSVTDPTGIRELRDELNKLDAFLVYDDFGAGQARLVEIADVPPDYLKFDRSLISQIDRASAPRRSLVQGLVNMALELEISLIAEGIETVAEANICRDLGFSFGQGYLFGEPEAHSEIDGELLPPGVDLR